MRSLVRPRASLTALSLLLGMLMASPALAQWKWRDATGRTQYSDRPPPASVPEKDILSKPSGYDRPRVVITPLGAASEPAPAASAAQSPRPKPGDPAADARLRQAAAAEEAQRTAEQARIAKQQADNCQRAREYARTLESGMRIARVDANGERAVMDDAQRAQELSRAHEVMASDCK